MFLHRYSGVCILQQKLFWKPPRSSVLCFNPPPYEAFTPQLPHQNSSIVLPLTLPLPNSAAAEMRIQKRKQKIAAQTQHLLHLSKSLFQKYKPQFPFFCTLPNFPFIYLGMEISIPTFIILFNS